MVDNTRERIGDDYDEAAWRAGEATGRIADPAGRGADIEPPGAGESAAAGTDDTLLSERLSDRPADGDDKGLMDKIKDALTGDGGDDGPTAR